MNEEENLNWRKGIKGELLKAVSQGSFGILSDLDGTLSQIVDNPDQAEMTVKNQEILVELSNEGVFIAILSGRSAGDLAERVHIPNARLIGNHGMEEWKDGTAIVAEEALVYRPQLALLAKELLHINDDGLRIEDKGVSIALHYRQHKQAEIFLEKYFQYLKQLAEEYGLIFTAGRRVFEFKAAVNIDKGSAVVRLIDSQNLKGAVILGDDNTDIAALQAAKERREHSHLPIYGIGVASEEGAPAAIAAADYYADGVEDVEIFLGWVAETRKASST